eukprot:7933253-Alexandrium_andersonii.AAC.1
MSLLGVPGACSSAGAPIPALLGGGQTVSSSGTGASPTTPPRGAPGPRPAPCAALGLSMPKKALRRAPGCDGAAP